MPPSYEVSTSIAAPLIRRCTSVKFRKPAHQLHALILTAGAQSPYANNNIISMYARCGYLGEAHKVFDKMQQRNTVSYNTLISSYARNPNYANLALNLITHMQSERLKSTGSTFTSLVQASAVLEDGLMGSLLHAQVVKLGFLDEVCVQTSILGMYSSCGDLESAERIFRCISDKDAVAWNSMVFGSLKNDKIEEGVNLFKSMLRSSVAPTQFTFSMVLNACGKLGDYTYGKIIHARVVVSDIVADLPLQNAILDMYCSCSNVEAAFYVFTRIEKPDLISWNTIIAGYYENGVGEKAIDFFIKLKRMPYPKPDEYTFATVISAMGKSQGFVHGKPIHGQVTKAGLEHSIFVGTTLVSMYFKNGDAESAQKIFNLIPDRDVVLWTEMIMGHSRIGNGENAIQDFLEMHRERNRTDGFAFSGVLGSCADMAMLKQGEMLHSLSIKTGFNTEMSVCGSLIDMYAKNGDVIAAESIFSHVSNPDLKCWNSMLGAYSQHGMAEEALNFFEQIVKQGLRPDQVTYLSLLSACNHKGLTQKGKFLWNHMKESGFTPGPKHYSCMVSLLSRAGLLDEALGLINEFPLREGHLELWRTLLSACVNTGTLEMGLHAAEQVLRLASEDTATHILVSNIYAVTGKWDKVAEMRRKIRDLVSVKDPGLSWIEAKNTVQVFSSGDQSHPEVDEAEDELHRLRSNMIDASIDEHDLGNFFHIV